MMIFAKGTCRSPVAGVVEVEFWNSMFQFGKFVLNQLMKCCWTAKEPGVPGTRGIRIGASIEPVLISKSGPAAGRFRSVESDKGVYAVTAQRQKKR